MMMKPKNDREIRALKLLSYCSFILTSSWSSKCDFDALHSFGVLFETIARQGKAYIENQKEALQEIEEKVSCLQVPCSSPFISSYQPLAEVLARELGTVIQFPLVFVQLYIWEKILLDRSPINEGEKEKRFCDNLSAILKENEGNVAHSKFRILVYQICLELPFEESEKKYNEVSFSLDEKILSSFPYPLNNEELHTMFFALQAEVACLHSCIVLTPHRKETLRVFIWFLDFCKKNGLSFFILGGSSLGAYRNGSFIPWDDDIDIGMRFEDLEKFRKLDKSSIPSGFFWSHPDTNLRHPRLFGKITYEGKSCLDVFPIVKTPINDNRAKIHFLLHRCFYRLYLKKIGYFIDKPKPKKKIRVFLFFFYSPLFSRAFLLKLAYWNMGRYEKNKNTQYLSICGKYGFSKERIENAWIDGPLTTMPFEGFSIRVFHQYEAYLQRLYGNYRLLPALAKRETPHNLRINENEIDG